MGRGAVLWIGKSIIFSIDRCVHFCDWTRLREPVSVPNEWLNNLERFKRNLELFRQPGNVSRKQEDSDSKSKDSGTQLGQSGTICLIWNAL